jgi:hypothetical protein
MSRFLMLAESPLGPFPDDEGIQLPPAWSPSDMQAWAPLSLNQPEKRLKNGQRPVAMPFIGKLLAPQVRGHILLP